MQNKQRRGFTLVELLVVIAIIGLLSTIAFIALNQARGKARDAKRVSDVRQLQSALELYYNDNMVGGSPAYPYNPGTDVMGSDVLPSDYVAQVPEAPTPNDPPCTISENQYTYIPLDNQNGTTECTTGACGWYTLEFCLGGATGNLSEGTHTATPAGIQ